MIAKGTRPRKAFVRVPLALVGEQAMTVRDPTARLYQAVADVASSRGMVDASLLVGYPWADEPRNGCSVVAYGDDAVTVEAHALRLAGDVWDARTEFGFGMPVASFDECLDIADRHADRGSVFISDAGDNVTGGGVGDVTYVLHRLLARPGRRAVVASIVDSEAVDICHSAGVGAMRSLSIGGKLAVAYGAPVREEVAVLEIGRLGARNRFARVRVHAVDVVLTESRTAFTTPKSFASVGVDLSAEPLIVVKLGYLFPELVPHADLALLAFTPGALDPDLRSLPFRRLSRPMYPLDPDMVWAPTLVPCSALRDELQEGERRERSERLPSATT
jgi:microcystin degradation protein MlrC